MTLCKDRPIANESVVYREDFDDWALLFDPDSARSYGINPVSAFIWHRLDGSRAISDIVAEIESEFEDVPADVDAHAKEFVDMLIANGLAGYEVR